MSIQEKAQEALAYFTEVNGRVVFVPDREPPLWYRRLLPNDAVYQSVYDILCCLADGTEPEEAVDLLSQKTRESDLLRWLERYPYAPDYIDEAVELWGYDNFCKVVGKAYYLYLWSVANVLAE